MEDAQAVALFQEVLATTRAGRIPWEPTVGDTLLAAIKGKRSLILRPYTEKDSFDNEMGWPTLIVRDASDRELLRVTTELKGVRVDQLQELYETARRQAFKVDEQVQDLLSDLKSL
jgi:hypothetical protein